MNQSNINGGADPSDSTDFTGMLNACFVPYRRRWIEAIKFNKEGTVFHKLLTVISNDKIEKVALLKTIGPMVIGGFDNRVILSIGLTNSEISELEGKIEAAIADKAPDVYESYDVSSSILNVLSRQQTLQLITGRSSANAGDMKNFIMNLIKDQPQVRDILGIMFQ